MPVLEAHNLDVMDRGAIAALTGPLDLDMLELRYIGGYEPDMFDGSSSPLVVRAPLGIARRLRRWHRLDDLNAPWISGYLCGVFGRR